MYTFQLIYLEYSFFSQLRNFETIKKGNTITVDTVITFLFFVLGELKQRNAKRRGIIIYFNDLNVKFG